MAVTGIYLVQGQGAPSLPVLSDRLARAFDPLPAGPWVLQHRLFRANPAPASALDTAPPRLQHLVALSHHAGRAFALVDCDDDATVAMPLHHMEPYAQLLSAKFGALWHYRTGNHVTNGAAYAVDGCVVRVGELRERGGQQAFRGLIVSIQTVKQESGEGVEGSESVKKDEKEPQELIRELWQKLDVRDAKQFMVSIDTDDVDAAAAQEAKLWCDVLRQAK
ncbi:uncharacterized protein K452DRAFT_306875 [Aplosporella prunicola CBS 121167]|uniref:Mediator of RNA polymerase II transcription subunit 20 n=1 Tax=Aplosporella prunicola CBS 121167 TaxID=1176127 RepID=A0A6A6BN79_9PEZI|nr:uncharacterized protein K452DRAFT_306875 [Aplosporella prunicola CBS 121167]KAF2144287.1 hypothetical protein K452DRAFT_306875 [Aplosporella prunicola CBS 121167]